MADELEVLMERVARARDAHLRADRIVTAAEGARDIAWKYLRKEEQDLHNALEAQIEAARGDAG